MSNIPNGSNGSNANIPIVYDEFGKKLNRNNLKKLNDPMFQPYDKNGYEIIVSKRKNGTYKVSNINNQARMNKISNVVNYNNSNKNLNYSENLDRLLKKYRIHRDGNNMGILAPNLGIGKSLLQSTSELNDVAEFLEIFAELVKENMVNQDYMEEFNDIVDMLPNITFVKDNTIVNYSELLKIVKDMRDDMTEYKRLYMKKVKNTRNMFNNITRRLNAKRENPNNQKRENTAAKKKKINNSRVALRPLTLRLPQMAGI